MRALMIIVYTVGRTSIDDRLGKPILILGSMSKVQKKNDLAFNLIYSRVGKTCLEYDDPHGLSHYLNINLDSKSLNLLVFCYHFTKRLWFLGYKYLVMFISHDLMLIPNINCSKTCRLAALRLEALHKGIIKPCHVYIFLSLKFCFLRYLKLICVWREW